MQQLVSFLYVIGKCDSCYLVLRSKGGYNFIYIDFVLCSQVDGFFFMIQVCYMNQFI